MDGDLIIIHKYTRAHTGTDTARNSASRNLSDFHFDCIKRTTDRFSKSRNCSRKLNVCAVAEFQSLFEGHTSRVWELCVVGATVDDVRRGEIFFQFSVSFIILGRNNFCG